MRILLIAVLFLASFAVNAESWDAATNVSDENDGVALYTKRESGKKYLSYKGEIIINAPLKTVLAALMVRDTFPSWWYNLKAVKTLENNNPQFSLAYYWVKGVWPTADRDLIVNNEVYQNPNTFEVVFHTKSADSNLVKIYPDRVRLKNVSSIIRALPIDSKTTKVTLEGSGDPGGVVPFWLANQFILDTPRESLKNLRNILERTPSKIDINLLDTDGFSKINMPKMKFPQ